MTNQSTIDKLIEMHMTPMADAFRVQKDDPSMKEVPFEDRFGMLVDTEYTACMHFAPLSGHRCVCRRTLGGGNGQRFNQSLSVLS